MLSLICLYLFKCLLFLLKITCKFLRKGLFFFPQVGKKITCPTATHQEAMKKIQVLTGIKNSPGEGFRSYSKVNIQYFFHKKSCEL